MAVWFSQTAAPGIHVLTTPAPRKTWMAGQPTPRRASRFCSARKRSRLPGHDGAVKPPPQFRADVPASICRLACGRGYDFQNTIRPDRAADAGGQLQRWPAPCRQARRRCPQSRGFRRRATETDRRRRQRTRSGESGAGLEPAQCRCLHPERSGLEGAVGAKPAAAPRCRGRPRTRRTARPPCR